MPTNHLFTPSQHWKWPPITVLLSHNKSAARTHTTKQQQQLQLRRNARATTSAALPASTTLGRGVDEIEQASYSVCVCDGITMANNFVRQLACVCVWMCATHLGVCVILSHLVCACCERPTSRSDEMRQTIGLTSG